MCRKPRCLKYAWVMFLLLLIPTASGCAGLTPTPEPVTIRFAYAQSEAEYYEAMIAAFNESYPHITVEVQGFGRDNSDVFIISPFALSELLEEGALLSLDPLIQQDQSLNLSDFYPGTVELFSREGKLWAVPAGVTMRVLYYNQDLFDRYGVPYPEPGWTWGDFVDTARALRDPEADVFGYGAVDQYLDPLAFIYQNGGRIVDDIQNPTRTTFDDPRTVGAMEWYAALIHRYNVAPTRSQASSIGGNVTTGVYLNQIGMWMGWIDEREGSDPGDSTWPGEWKMRWGMVPLPRGVQAAVPMSASGYAISSETAHPDACWQWISFLSGQVRPPHDMIPARKSLAESAEYRKLVGDDVVEVAQTSIEDAVLLSPSLVESVNIRIYGRAIESIVSGNTTPQEALTRAQQQAEGGH